MTTRIEPGDCQYEVIATGCWSGGRWIALRNNDGTVELLDDITGDEIAPTVCCNFPDSTYTDNGNGGLHCFDDAPAGVCNIPAGTYTVTAGGDTSPWAGTLRVLFSDGQVLYEDNSTTPKSCGDFGEEGPPVFASGTFTFAGPVTATLAFEQDNGQGVPYPIVAPFVCYTPADVETPCAEKEFITTERRVSGPYSNVSGNGQLAVFGHLAGQYLHSWWVRNVGTGVVDVNVNGVNTQLQPGEQMGSTAQDDRRLTDYVYVTTNSAGNVADFVTVRRVGA